MRAASAPDSNSRGKHPIHAGWQHLAGAKADEATIRQWWAQYPLANIGAVLHPGLVVADFDPRNDADGTAGALFRSLPATLETRTGNGGGHKFYSADPSLKFPEPVTGLEIKQVGNQVVLPPSVTTAPYSWVNVTPVAALPLALAATGRPRGERSEVVIVEDDDDHIVDNATIENVVELVTPYFIEGKRHHIAKNLSAWLKQRGFSFGDVRRVIERLPCKDPRAKFKAAKAAFGIERPFGWTELKGVLGDAPAAALDSATPNPRREGQQAELAGLVEAMASGAVEAKPRPALILAPPSDMVSRLRGLQRQGPAHATGVAPLDRALRGGMREEKIMIVGGAPGAGKTSLARQIADYLARSGVAIGWLASDEEPSAIDVRRLQAIGIPRHDAEHPDEVTIARAGRELAPLPFVIFDVAEGWTIERAFAELARLYPGWPRGIVADSLQTVRTERTAALDSVRARIDDVIATAKAAARAPATRAMVFFTSELARGSYRSEASADAINDLAAFKESGGIEYGAHVLLVLRSVKGDGQFVEVSMPKNRLGTKLDFMLRMDPETTNLAESFENPREAQLAAAAAAAVPDVLRVLEASSWPGISGRQIEKLVPRDAHVVRAALQVMAQKGIAFPNSGPRNAILWTVPMPRSGAPANDPIPPPPLRRAAPEPSTAESLQELGAALAQKEAAGK